MRAVFPADAADFGLARAGGQRDGPSERPDAGPPQRGERHGPGPARDHDHAARSPKDVRAVFPADAALLGFARALRAAGVEAGSERVHAFLSAVDVLGPERRADVYWAGRLTLCGERDDLERYDRVFGAFFDGAAAPPRRPAPVRRVARARLIAR
ncbi:hypothetical protein GA0115233_106449, partial [Streptomyces sp. DI166]